MPLGVFNSENTKRWPNQSMPFSINHKTHGWLIWNYMLTELKSNSKGETWSSIGYVHQLIVLREMPQNAGQAIIFWKPDCIALILKYQSYGTLKLDKIIDKVEYGTLLGRTNCTSKYKSTLIIIKWAFNQFEKPTLARADEVFLVWPLGCGLRNCVVGFCISQFNSSKFVLLSYNMNPSAIDVE